MTIFFFDKFQFREFDIFFRIFREFAVVKNQQKCLMNFAKESTEIVNDRKFEFDDFLDKFQFRDPDDASI